MLKMEGFDKALLGTAWVDGGEVLVYSGNKLMGLLMTESGMCAEGAMEFIEFNIEGARMGMGSPLLVWEETMEEVMGRMEVDDGDQGS